MPGSTALARARQSGLFTAVHEAFWAHSRTVNGDADGTPGLIDVLLLHRSMAVDHVIAGIEKAVTVGAVSADVVALEARRHVQTAKVGPIQTVLLLLAQKRKCSALSVSPCAVWPILPRSSRACGQTSGRCRT